MTARPPSLHDLPDQPRVNSRSNDCFHHSQVFQIVVRLEERIAGEELHQNTPDTPDITRETPAEVQDDFRRAVVPCGDNGGMVLVIEGGRPEVDEPDLGVEKDAALAGVAGRRMRG